MRGSRSTNKGPLVVDVCVLFAVISSEPGLSCCLPSDLPRSVDILLLFVHRKSSIFLASKVLFWRVCQDVFGAYLQLLSDSERAGPLLRSRGGRLLCALSVFTEGENWLKGCQSTWKHTLTHKHTHTHAPTSTDSLSAASLKRAKCLK